MFIEILCQTEVAEIKAMNLDSYLLSMRCKDNAALVLIYYFLTKRTNEIKIGQIVNLISHMKAKRSFCHWRIPEMAKE